MSDGRGRRGFGAVPPPDQGHARAYPFLEVAGAAPTFGSVEAEVPLPEGARTFYDQGLALACVGFSSSQLMTLLNGGLYDARWLWQRAKSHDDLGETVEGDAGGVSLRGAARVLHTIGHARKRKARDAFQVPRIENGIAAYRWGERTPSLEGGRRNVEMIRSALAAGLPVVITTGWYGGMSYPSRRPNGETWVDENRLGVLEGHHAYLIEAWSDRRDAARTPNSWGARPRLWLPRVLLEWLMTDTADHWSELMVVTDR